MSPARSFRILLTAILLILGTLSLFVFPPVQADTSSSSTSTVISPAIESKISAFMVKVQAKRSNYSSDTDWNVFLDKLGVKIGALESQYTGNDLILAILGRLSVKVGGLKIQNITASPSTTSVVSTNSSSPSTTSVDEEDLCKKEGLSNIDETNFSVAKNVVRTNKSMSDSDTRGWWYKMNTGESYSFPIDISHFYMTGDKGSAQLSTDPYLRSYWYVFKISERKCDFTIPKAITYTDPKNTYVVPDQCFGQGRSGEDTRHIVARAKYADPNYVFTSNDAVGCKLVPGKKYYLNVRWIRKSDIVDENGNLRDRIFGEKPSASFDANKNGAGFLRQFLGINSLSTLTKPELNTLLDGRFNIQGDTCLGKKDWLYGECTVDWRQGWDTLKMPKFTPQRQKEVDAIYAADQKAIAEWSIKYQAESARLYKQEYDRLMKEEYTTFLEEENRIRAGTDIIASRHRLWPIDTYIKTIFENRAKDYASRHAGDHLTKPNGTTCEVGPCN